jgi:hypothetical protein
MVILAWTTGAWINPVHGQPCDCPVTGLAILSPTDDGCCANCQHVIIVPEYAVDNPSCVGSEQWFMDGEPFSFYTFVHTDGPHVVSVQVTSTCGLVSMASTTFHVQKAQALVVKGYPGFYQYLPTSSAFWADYWMNEIHGAAMAKFTERGWNPISLPEPTIEQFVQAVEAAPCLQAVYLNAHGAYTKRIQPSTYVTQFTPPAGEDELGQLGCVPSQDLWGFVGSSTDGFLRFVTANICRQDLDHIWNSLGPPTNFETLWGPSETINGSAHGHWGDSNGRTEYFAAVEGHGIPENSDVDLWPAFGSQAGALAISRSVQSGVGPTPVRLLRDAVTDPCTPEYPATWLDLEAALLQEDPYLEKSRYSGSTVPNGTLLGCGGAWDLEFSSQSGGAAIPITVSSYRNLPDGLESGANWDILSLSIGPGGEVLDNVVLTYRYSSTELSRLGFGAQDLVGVAGRWMQDAPYPQPPGVGASFAGTLLPVDVDEGTSTAQMAIPRDFLPGFAGGLVGRLLVAIAPFSGPVGLKPMPRIQPADLEIRMRSAIPVRSEARFVVRSPESGSVGVGVFSVGGRRLRTLREQLSETGEREFVWDTRDSDGRRVAPGVYFLRAATGRLVAIHKIVVVR